MPASNMSCFSVGGAPRSYMAASYAETIARNEIWKRIQSGHLDQNDRANVYAQFMAIYKDEYYKLYPLFPQMNVDYSSARKFYAPHALAKFTKSNCLMQVHKGCISIRRVNFPLDEDNMLETKEVFLTAWPGPLDDSNNQGLKSKVASFMDTLLQHDSQRRIRYNNNDDQRKTILKLLKELLHRDGLIDAAGVTGLLLKPEQTEIQKDEAIRKPLETLKKYLLLGKRSEAIRFAESKRLWDHALCLSFLDKYQPSNTITYQGDGASLKDDSIVQSNNNYISAIDDEILNTVYRSLLNRLLQSDPDSAYVIQQQNVANDPYKFAILSANDCDMDFDQTNELFKLIVAIKFTLLNPYVPSDHLINLGDTNVDTTYPSSDMSLPSDVSFKASDTFASRTLTISNIDMLIFNEIWEYCLNLAKGTCNSNDYNYISDLVPYKLIFASRLLDFGLYRMFAYYLNSIKKALVKHRHQEKDPFYDWDTIERSVENLEGLWKLFRESSETITQSMIKPESLPAQPPPHAKAYNEQPVYNPIHSLTDQLAQTELISDHLDSSNNGYTSLPYQGENAFNLQNNAYSRGRHNIPPPIFNQRPIREEVNSFDFNPDIPPEESQVEERNPYEPQQTYNEYPSEPSRRTSMDMPAFSPPSFGPTGSMNHVREQNAMTSSSPVNKNRDSMQSNPPMGDSFNTPLSPINAYDDLPRPESDLSRKISTNITNNSVTNNQMRAGTSSSNADNNNSNNMNNKPQQAGDQQSGILNYIIGSVLPKSNSKQMILPDDSRKKIVYDEQTGRWIDTEQGDSADTNNLDDAPPLAMNVPNQQAPRGYSSNPVRSSKARYPKPT